MKLVKLNKLLTSVGFVLDAFVVGDSQTDLHSSFPFWVINGSSSQLIMTLQYSQVPMVVESKLQKPPVPHSAESVQLLPFKLSPELLFLLSTVMMKTNNNRWYVNFNSIVILKHLIKQKIIISQFFCIYGSHLTQIHPQIHRLILHRIHRLIRQQNHHLIN